MNTLLKDYLPNWLETMDKRMLEFHDKKDKDIKHFVGDRPTIADF